MWSPFEKYDGDPRDRRTPPGIEPVNIAEDERTMYDGRLIRTAVVGRRDSTEPVYLPLDYAGASDVLRRHRQSGFSCGIHLGGCGWPLLVRRSRQDLKVAHFAHRPNGPVCPRHDGLSPGSADHLFIYNGLVFLARRNGGNFHRAQRTDIDISNGRCASVLLRGDRTAVRVQFMDLAEDVWRVQDGELRHSFENIQWIFGQGVSGPVEALKDRDGYVLRARCEFRNGAREVLVRKEAYGSVSDWIPLHDCLITASGTVLFATAADSSATGLLATVPVWPFESIEAAENTPISGFWLAAKVRPVLRDLAAAMARDDWQAARAIRAAQQPLLNRLADSSLYDEKQQLRVIMRWHVHHPSAPRQGPRTEKKPNREMKASASGAAARTGVKDSKRKRGRTPPPPKRDMPIKLSSQERFRRRATGIVLELETARYNNDADEIRALWKSNSHVLEALRKGDQDGLGHLRSQLIRVRAWLLNQPAAKPERPGRTEST
ncbi:hypothetical protein [Nocardia sp. NPDC056100]|uniref:hypothetical protein n=1 Tax=Nocardia sp. NPDC056100 TaxID=3345712 RepID=UPI0035DEF45D